MTATSFDTLKATRELEAAGIDRPQAEAIAAAMRGAAVADHDQRATKTDIRWILAILGFQSAFILAIAGRMFGLF